MLEKIIENLILNFKKYLYAIFGLIIGILIVEYGFFEGLVIVMLSIIGYRLGDQEFLKALKKYIKKRFEN